MNSRSVFSVELKLLVKLGFFVLLIVLCESIGCYVLVMLCLDTRICKGQSSYRANNSVILNEWEPRLIASCPMVQFLFAPLIFYFLLA